MRPRAQPNDLGSKAYGLVVTVPRDMLETDEDGHVSLLFADTDVPQLRVEANLISCLLDFSYFNAVHLKCVHAQDGMYVRLSNRN
jgi:hypothetical protein